MDFDDDDPSGPVVHLPTLTPDEALRFVAILESITRAIWWTYGERMSELLITDPSRRCEMPQPLDNPLSDDADLPF